MCFQLLVFLFVCFYREGLEGLLISLVICLKAKVECLKASECLMKPAGAGLAQRDWSSQESEMLFGGLTGFLVLKQSIVIQLIQVSCVGVFGRCLDSENSYYISYVLPFGPQK